MKLRTLSVAMSFSLLAAAVSACAAKQPPKTLVDARAAYQDASKSDAAQLKPAELHVAKEALDHAEELFTANGDDDDTQGAAYVALRKAELAGVLAVTAKAETMKVDFEKQATATTAEQLDESKTKLKAKDGELASTKGLLATSKEATAAEKAARLAAEKQAKDAMNALAASLAVKEDPRGTVITLPGGVLFATNQSTILPGATSKLDTVAEALKTQGEHHFTVEGHTDNQGTDAVNEPLSKKRAEAVRDYLVVHGVAAEAISAIGYGSTHPIGDNKTVEGRAMNRRVEIVVGK